MNQSEFLAIGYNLVKGREKSRVQGAIGLGFASHRLKSLARDFQTELLSVACAIDSHLNFAFILQQNLSARRQFWT